MNDPAEPVNFREIAHTLKNHLAIIVGFADVLLADTPDDDPRRRDLLEILNSAQRALELVNELHGRRGKQS